MSNILNRLSSQIRSLNFRINNLNNKIDKEIYVDYHNKSFIDQINDDISVPLNNILEDDGTYFYSFPLSVDLLRSDIIAEEGNKIINIIASGSFTIKFSEILNNFKTALLTLKIKINDTVITENEISLVDNEYRNIVINHNAEIDYGGYSIILEADCVLSGNNLLNELPRLESTLNGISLTILVV